MPFKKTKKDEAAIKDTTKNVRHTDANPEVRDASPLNKTQAQVEKELREHPAVEQRTGVHPDELDTRPVVDADPGEGKSFAERTREGQPWREFQDQAADAREKRAADKNSDTSN